MNIFPLPTFFFYWGQTHLRNLSTTPFVSPEYCRIVMSKQNHTYGYVNPISMKLGHISYMSHRHNRPEGSPQHHAIMPFWTHYSKKYILDTLSKPHLHVPIWAQTCYTYSYVFKHIGEFWDFFWDGESLLIIWSNTLCARFW
jgi:hypothetical protein